MEIECPSIDNIVVKERVMTGQSLSSLERCVPTLHVGEAWQGHIGLIMLACFQNGPKSRYRSDKALAWNSVDVYVESLRKECVPL